MPDLENEDNVEPAGFQPVASDLQKPSTLELDLSNQRLTGLEMRGADLSHVDLSNTVIAGSNLAGVNLSHAQLSGATVIATNLEGADFSGGDLSHSKWIAVNITGAKFGDAVMNGVRSAVVDWSSAKEPPVDKPGLLITPVIFMPLLIAGGVLLSLILRWKNRKSHPATS